MDRKFLQSVRDRKHRLKEKTKSKYDHFWQYGYSTSSFFVDQLNGDTKHAASISVAEHKSNDEISVYTDASDPNAKQDVWALARQKLQQDPAKRKELETLDSLIEDRLGSELRGMGPKEKQDRILLYVVSHARQLQHKGRGSRLGEYTQKARELFETAVHGVSKTTDVIKAASAPCLPASIACVGVLLFLSISVQAIDERETFYDAMNTISWSVCHIVEYEALLWEKNSWPPAEEVKTKLVKTCADIIYLQAKAARALDRNAFLRTLRYAFKYDEWKELTSEIQKGEATIKDCAERQDLRLGKDTYTMIKRMKDEQRAQRKEQELEARRKRVDAFLDDLYHQAYRYEASKNRNDVRTEGTCQWFVKQQQFQAWNSSVDADHPSSPFLYVTADPGCGKSVLSRHLVDEVLPREGRTVCYSFFKDDFEDQKDSLKAVCVLLHQLLDANLHLLMEDDEILHRYESRGEGFFDSFDEVWNTFTLAAARQETVCVLDALDECRSADRSQLFRAISEASVSSLKIMFTSRPYEDIYREISQLDKRELPLIRLHGDRGPMAEEIVAEIQLVIASRINKMEQDLGLTRSERKLLEKQINSVPNRTYLWVTLVFDGLMKSFESRRNIEDLTRNLPQGIEEAYEKILSKSLDRKKTEKLLHIILAARRPLTLSEMAVALAVDGQRSWAEIADDIIPDTRTLRSIRNLCGLFVTIVDDKVYFLHQTAREFLLNNNPDKHRAMIKHNGQSQNKTTATSFLANLFVFAFFIRIIQSILSRYFLAQPRIWQHSMYLLESNTILGDICISCLQHDDMNSHHAMFSYAAEFWADHYHHATVAFQKAATGRARDLCMPSSTERTHWPDFLNNHLYPTRGSPLSLASALGLSRVVASLLPNRSEPNDLNPDHALDQTGKTALVYAAQHGHEAVAKLLISRSVSLLNLPDDRYGQTPLSWAAENGHTGVVQLLLHHDADVNQPDKRFGQTPISWAAENGHSAVVRELMLAGNADVNAADKFGRTPLSYAADQGREEIVQLLLTSSTTPLSPPSSTSSSSLSLPKSWFRTWKSWRKPLYADPNLPDSDHRTPLSWAAQRGHTGVVRTLLAARAQVDAADSKGRTPLGWAVRRGHEEVAGLLVANRAAVDWEDGKGVTPLGYAEMKGDYGVVKVLEKGLEGGWGGGIKRGMKWVVGKGWRAWEGMGAKGEGKGD